MTQIFHSPGTSSRLGPSILQCVASGGRQRHDVAAKFNENPLTGSKVVKLRQTHELISLP
jgi:hypothetical protein